MLELSRPGALWLWVGLLLFWLWCERRPPGRAPAGQISRRRRRLSTGLRWLTWTALVLALAGLRQQLPSDRLTVTFLVDQSLSTRRQQASIQDTLRRALEARPRSARVAMVYFAGEAALELPATHQPFVPRSSQKLNREQSDLAGAVQYAAAAQPAGESGRLVLISDGRETRGNLVQAAGALPGAGMELDTLAVAQSDAPEALIEDLRCPPSVKRKTPFDLVATIYASQAMPGADLQLFRQGRPAGRFRVDLQPGRNVYLLPQTLTEAGAWRYQLQLSVPQDGERSNNQAAGLTLAEGPSRIALIRNYGAPDALAPALRAQGLEVDSLVPDQLPAELGEWLSYQAVVLDDVPSTALATDHLESLAALVREAGVGLVMLGGPDSFAAGGYARTPLAEVLPVDLRVRRGRLTPPTAQIHVIDKSGSMSQVSAGQEHIALAREASIAALELLSDEDQFGVVAFDDASKWVVPLTRVTNPPALAGRISTLRAGGGTDMYPALRAAVDALSRAGPASRHILVLSDGATSPADFDRLAAEAGRHNIRISTVAVGDGADITFLERLARLGKGRAYQADSARALPRIFARETMLTARAAFDERPAQVEALGGHPILQGVSALWSTPLLGHNLSVPRGAPHRVLLQTAAHDPILAAGRHGLGKAVAFTGDDGRRWSRSWSQRSEFAQLLVQAIRWSLPQTQTGGLEASTRLDPLGRLEIRAQVSPELAPQGLVGSLLGPDGKSQTLELLQVAPNRYEVNSDFSGSGTFVLNLASPDGSLRLSQPIDLKKSQELSGVEVQSDLLRQAATAGGGLSSPTPEQLYRRPAHPRAHYQDLQPQLLICALLLLLLDVAVRRLSWPRRSARPTPAPAPETEEPVLQLRTRLKRSDSPRRRLELPVELESPSPAPAPPETGTALEGLRKIKRRSRSTDTES